MRYFFSVLCIFIGINIGFSQINISNKVVDYGSITQQSDRLVDLIITNEGVEKVFILRTDFGPEFKILYSSNNRTIAPDSSIILRVRFDPRKEGTFRIKNSIWVSSEDKPITITFKGNVEFVQNSYNTPCPDFNQTSSSNSRTDKSDLTIEVVDKITLEKIKNARIRIVEQGRVQKTLFTNKRGMSEIRNIPISYYYLLVDAPEYKGQDTALYINKMTPNLYFELEKSNKDIVILEDTEEKPENTPAIIIDKPVTEEQDEIFVEDTSEDLPESLYKKNNIVFLIDVSQSMNQKGKLELLKSSMLALVDILREEDEITIITYATNPKILLPTTSGIDKKKTKEIISLLKAGGSTSGSKGFKMAYEEVIKNLLADGNNQVIVATDGVFKEEDNPKIIRLVKKHQNKNIKTSVIGIKSNEKTSQKLSEISQLGNGSFIYIEEYDASQKVLIEEIKKQSKIRL